MANLALCHTGLGDRGQAERIYQKMLDADPEAADALRGLAAMAVQTGNHELALEYHVRLIELGRRR